jgi:hypothetical protein
MTDSNGTEPTEAASPPRTERRPDRGGRRKSAAPSVPIWVLAVALVVVAAVAGGGVWLVMSGTATTRDRQVEELKTNNSDLLAQVDDLKAQLASGVGGASLDSSETIVVSDPGGATVVVESGKASFAFIDDVTGSAAKGFKVAVFYAQLLRGKAAADAAKAAGDDPPGPAPGDYYIIEGSADPKNLPLAPNAEITVLGWKGAAATASAKITAAEFAKVMPSGSAPQDAYAQGGYNVTVTNGTVTKIEQLYLP